jgi:hypothetical protein
MAKTTPYVIKKMVNRVAQYFSGVRVEPDGKKVVTWDTDQSKALVYESQDRAEIDRFRNDLGGRVVHI